VHHVVVDPVPLSLIYDFRVAVITTLPRIRDRSRQTKDQWIGRQAGWTVAP
jgi:hypothetical protein